MRAPIASSGATVGARAIAQLLRIGTEAGVSESFLAQAAQVDPKSLADPDARVPLAAEIAIWQALAARISDPGFGVRAGASYRVRDAGLAGYLFCFSRSLRDALHRLERFGSILTEAVKFTIEDGDPLVGRTTCEPSLGAGQPYAQDYRLAAVLSVCREVTRADITPDHVTFNYPRPSSTLAHRDYFRCPMTFDAPTTSVAFRMSDLALPSVKGDETLVGYLSDHAEQVLATLLRQIDIRDDTRAAIWALLGDGPPSLARVAAFLELAPRTLQRQLASEGTSLQREIEHIRHTMALAVARDRTVPIAEIAYLLGYSEPSAFFRAFKRWTGTTPGRFRREARKAS